MDALRHDLHGALRALRARPGFSAAAILILALGIGANAAIFSVVRAVLLRQLPYREPDRLVMLQVLRTDGDREGLSIPDFLDYRAATGMDMAAWTETGINLTGSGEPERLFRARVSSGFFEVLGARPALGRALGPGDDKVVVLGDALWRRRFAADPSVLGRSIVLDGESYVVAGVMAPDFLFPGARAELATPFDLTRDGRAPRRDAAFLRVVARLPPGKSAATAAAALATVATRLARDFPTEDGRKQAILVSPIAEDMVGRFRGMLALLLGAVALVLVIACMNLASLLLAAGVRRRRELALRAALGAGAGRLARQLLLENALLTAAGAALGLLLAGWGGDALAAISPAQIPRLRDTRLDATVIAFTVALAAATALLFGLVPALRAARDAAPASLLGGRAGAPPGHGRARRALVALQVALALSLLAPAGLLLAAFARLEAVRPGFEPTGALSMRLALPAQRYPDRAAVVAFDAELRRRLLALPGVGAAGSIQILPLTGSLATVDFTVAGRPPPRADAVPQAHYRMVGPGAFAALGIALVAGRELAAQEPEPVVVVNRRLADRFFGGDALGAHLVLDEGNGAPRDVRIVGVAGDVREVGLDAEPSPTVYVPLSQTPDSVLVYGRNRMWVVRGGVATRAVADAVHALDALLPVAQLGPLEQVIAGALAPRRFNVVLVAAFALAALLLAVLGIYAMAAELAASRTRELGIRLALGATPRALVRHALGDGMRPVFAGLLAGAAGAIAATRLAGDLVQLDARDPWVFAAAAAALAAAALVAAWIPARRAARTDPQVVLRIDQT